MKHTAKALVLLLTAVLLFGLCACSFGKKEAAPQSGVSAITDYAKRLSEAGYDAAAAAAMETLPNAVKAEAQEHAITQAERDSDFDLLRTVAKMNKAPLPAAVSFTDVQESDWFYDAVKWAAKNGIVSGDTFSPNAPCTRAQTLTFLWRAKGMPAPAKQDCPFTDVAQGAYYYEPVLWAFKTGLLSASNDGLFHADDPVTRAQVVTFLYRAEGSPQPHSATPYSDVQDTDWFAPQAIWAYEAGIVTLNDAKTFSPNDACNRAQYVNFLFRCYGN